ncbi:hypothetical protein I3843_01G092400, partial [Carya illinoinensis]
MAISRGAPQLSHLLFAYESILFCNANSVENNHMQTILSMYAGASSQMINKRKMKTTFNRNTSLDEQRKIKESWGVYVATRHDKYLGLPALMGKSKINSFRMI